jgi:hypothetical protein
MPENYHTETVIFDIMEVNLPNAIISRPVLYQLMAVTHYRHLVLKMPSSNGIIKIRGDRTVGAFTLEKLQALAAAQRVSSSAPRVQPSDNVDIPVKVIQIGTDVAQTTCIVGNLGDK